MKIWLACLISLPLIVHSQSADDWRVIPSITDWIEEINNSPDSIYRAERIEVRIDFEKDTQLVSYQPNIDAPLQGGESRDERLKIDKHIRIIDIRFRTHDNRSLSNTTLLNNLHFTKSVRIYYLKNHRFGIQHSTFDDLLMIRLIDTRFYFQFNHCDFKGPVVINNPLAPTPFQFTNCSSDAAIIISADDESPSLSIRNSRLNYLELGATSDFKEIYIDSTDFKLGVSFARMSVSNSIFMRASSMNYLDITGAQLPTGSTYMPFDSLHNRLCIALAGSYDFGEKLYDPMQGKLEEELMNYFQMDNLVGSYYKLLNIYKSRGEMRSYNAAYIEMRDKQTAQSKLIYESDTNFQKYFDWQINRFTKVFSDYGTRPAKAILIFFQVVLAFSLFYFFFPSTWNTSNSRKIMKRISYLGSYFTSSDGLSDLFEQETKDEYRDYEEFHQFIQSSDKELPAYFQLLGRPLYQLSVSRFNFTRGILRKTEILNGKWSELPNGKKLITSLVIGLYLLLYLIWVFLVRCLNAITLSLNAFSTLGFGEIPTRGLARYVAIIQGFVGWFLLSIFLVSLIGQILN